MSKVRFQIVPPIDRPGEPVFVVGNVGALGNWTAHRGLRLSWNPPFHTGEIAVETGTHLEYKILRGSWEKEAVDARGNVCMNATHEAWLDQTLFHTVADWKDRYRGRLTSERLYSRVLAEEREILVWLPPGYPAFPIRRFPLIILHDGANVFDPATSAISGVDWAADEWVNLLSSHGQFPEAIIAAVRHPDGYAEENITRRDFELSLPYGGPAYAEFVATELPGHLDAHYRTVAEPASRMLGGAGLGATNTLFTALRHPGVFTSFVCLSTIFEDGPENVRLPGFLETLPRLPSGIRMFFDYGTRGLDAEAGPAHDRLRKILAAHGWREGREFALDRVEGGSHEELSWRRRFGDALRFLGS